MLASRLSAYAERLSYSDLPSPVVHEVKRRVLDSLGCAFGAMNAPPAKIARRVAAAVPLREGATVWGTGTRTTADLAAFANGTLVRYLDFNDTYLAREPAHPSDNIPPCLAVAEFTHASGKSLILAIALAYEIQCRLCDAAALRPRGWDHVTYGAFSTALAAAKLMRLRGEAIMHAVSLAGVTAGALRQTRVGEVSLWKACAFANAARNGVFAAWLARHGMTGPPAIFEGEKGFMRIISGDFSLPALGGERGTGFMIPDTYIKPRPLEYHAQSAVEAAFDVRRQLLNGERIPAAAIADRIAGVQVESFDVAVEIIGRDPEKWRPQTRETADHSLPYCVAAALLDGVISPQSFTLKRLKDPTLHNLIQKVRVTAVKELTDRYPDAMPNRVRVRSKGGREYTSQVDHPVGHPQRPLSDDALEEKFYRLARPRLGLQKARRLVDRIWNLEQLKDVRTLPPLLMFTRTSRSGRR